MISKWLRLSAEAPATSLKNNTPAGWVDPTKGLACTEGRVHVHLRYPILAANTCEGLSLHGLDKRQVNIFQTVMDGTSQCFFKIDFDGIQKLLESLCNKNLCFSIRACIH